MFKLSLLLAITVILFGLFNYAIDSMWCFKHANKYNRYQSNIDERQQKTNFLAFKQNGYDTLILGNSRTAQINQNDFKGMKAFNYATAAMTPYEYQGFVENFKVLSGAPKTIILGLDFNNTIAKKSALEKPPAYYREKTGESFYRFKTLITKDLFNYSILNLKLKRRIENKKFRQWQIVYDRNNIASLTPSNEAVYREEFDKLIAEISHVFKDSYKYNSEVIRIYGEVVSGNPGSRVIAFTAPMSKPYFCAATKERPAEFERWLRDMVAIFGEVWHFEHLNSVAENYEQYFVDGNHFYPEVGTMIAHTISGSESTSIPAEFGILLTKANIDEKIKKIRSEISECQ